MREISATHTPDADLTGLDTTGRITMGRDADGWIWLQTWKDDQASVYRTNGTQTMRWQVNDKLWPDNGVFLAANDAAYFGCGRGIVLCVRGDRVFCIDPDTAVPGVEDYVLHSTRVAALACDRDVVYASFFVNNCANQVHALHSEQWSEVPLTANTTAKKRRKKQRFPESTVHALGVAAPGQLVVVGVKPEAFILDLASGEKRPLANREYHAGFVPGHEFFATFSQARAQFWQPDGAPLRDIAIRQPPFADQFDETMSLESVTALDPQTLLLHFSGYHDFNLQSVYTFDLTSGELCKHPLSDALGKRRNYGTTVMADGRGALWVQRNRKNLTAYMQFVDLDGSVSTFGEVS